MSCHALRHQACGKALGEDLGNFLAGLVYVLFCWTLIPALAGLSEGIKYALMDGHDFQRRYSQ